MKEQSLVNADLGAAWPIHLREADSSYARTYLQNSNISAYGKPVSACSRPFFWFDIGRFDWTYTPLEQRVKFVNGWEVNQSDWNAFNGWIPDNAHQPDLFSIPYMLIGDYWYLEELIFIASYGTVNSNGSYTTSYLGRGPTGAEGNLGDQIRGCAWNLRTRARTAILVPDTFVEKIYFTQKVNEQIEIWEGSKDIVGTSNYNSANYLWGKNIHKTTVNNNYGNSPLQIWEIGSTYHVQYEINADSALYAISPWEINFLIFSLGHIEELGFASSPLRKYIGRYLVDMITKPESTPYNVALSRLPVVSKETGQYFNYWRNITNAINYNYFNQDIQHEFNSQLTDTEHGYANIAMCATSFITDLPNGNGAWLFMDTQAINNPLLHNNPKWAIVPRDSSAYCLTKFSNQTFEICEGDSIQIFGKWLKAEGTYLDTFPLSTFCDSIVVTALIVHSLPPTPIATQAANIIYSSSSTGNQWYNSSGIIYGEVSQVFIPDSVGIYFVIVTDSNGCKSLPSNSVNFILTSIKEYLKKQIHIYPNPANNYIVIEITEKELLDKKMYYEISTIGGQTQKVSSLKENKSFINVENLPSGIYFIKIYKENSLIGVYKVVVN